MTTTIPDIFAHGIKVSIDPNADVFIVSGKGWEEEVFNLYLTREEAASLIAQLGYQVYEVETTYLDDGDS